MLLRSYLILDPKFPENIHKGNAEIYAHMQLSDLYKVQQHHEWFSMLLKVDRDRDV